MSNENSDQEKTEAASPRRLEKAREEGQVARSRELTTFLLLACGLACLWAMGRTLYSQLGRIMEQAFLFERNQVLEVEPMLSKAVLFGGQSLEGLLPFFLVMVVVALGSPMLLGGLLISGKSLQPQFSRLNPLKGLKRIFSVQALAELAKVLTKALVFGGVLFAVMTGSLGDFVGLLGQPVESALVTTLQLIVQACGAMVFALFVVVVIDVPYQLWHHAKQLRMTKEEVKREFKESDGDPQVKSRIRAQQQSMARQRMMSSVPLADVIVTNPTHYAIALRYDENSRAAPRVVAKGVDELALRIRALAIESKVPMLEAPPLARALYRHVDIDQEIPAQLYTAVAEVLAWAFSLKSTESDERPIPKNLPIPESMIDAHNEGLKGSNEFVR